MKVKEKKHKKSGWIPLNPLKIKQVSLPFLFLFFLLLFVENTQAQSIPGTGSSAGICGNCNPTGWADADPLLDGTPDISNRNIAGGGTFYGAGASWTAAPLPLPPTGDVRWITLRDVGTSGSVEENVTTTMTGLIVGRTYKLVISSMTSTTNLDGGTGGDEPYAGVFIEDFDIQVGSNPRRTITTVTQNVWGNNTIIFIAGATSETFSIFPGADSNAGNVINDVEMVHISVDGLTALELLDTDGDGADDSNDIDDDNDGILDFIESGGFFPNGDEDGDGIANYQDVFDDTAGDGDQGFTDYTDANSDGFPDAYDFDGDGISNHLDLDSDNDGILDNIEAQVTGGGFITFTSTDTDMDGLVDVYDTTPNGTAAGEGSVGISPLVTDPGIANDDTTPDYLDIDTDDDGIPDNVEAQTTLGYTTPTGNVGINGVDSAYENVDTYTPTGINIEDTDIDGILDYRDTDSDNDGTPDIQENNDGDILSGSDTDGDGLDNNFDADNVNYDVNDNNNTPSTSLGDSDSDVNSGGNVDYRDDVEGLDSDGDGIPDLVDIDDDDDGIIDTEECSNTNFPAGGANAITVDNGVNRETEILDGVNGGGNGARMNNTNDVLVLQLRAADAIVPAGTVITITTTASNTADKQLRFQQSDASGNNTSNNWDVTYNMSPAGDQDFTGSGNATNHIVTYTLATDATHIRITMPTRSGGRINMDYLEYASFNICSPVDTDGDGITDDLDIDSDNDGIIDNYEAQSTAGYVAKSGVDSDNDGLDDAYDDDLGGAANSNGILQSEWINTDGSLTNSDTIPDHRDIDSDNDGIPDNIEAQTTTGYVAPNGVPGANGLDSAYDFTDSFANIGLSTSLINTDGDAEPDYRDTDADGDGTNDDAEGRTGTPTWAGTDTDGDGLDNGYDNVDTTGGTFDVNDNISDPETAGLIDVDADVSTGGDVDYRDTLVGQDTDGDGIVDSVDIDDDNDGILDTVEGEVADFDGDGIPNSLDMDSDGDGILDNVEAQTTAGFIAPPTTDIATAVGANGLFSIYENNDTAGATSIVVPITTTATDTTPDYLDIDTDDDGIPDNVEAQTTQGYTAPSGTIGLNGVDVNYENNDTFTATGLDPNNHDGTDEPDYRDTNSDNDATLDADENGLTPNGGGAADADGDGLLDNWEGSDATGGEAYDVNDEVNTPVSDLLDVDGDGATTGDVDYRDDTIFIDTDGDGVGDDVDIDDDNDGILDINEDALADGDFDGIINSLDIDSDDDGIPDNVEAQSTIGYIPPSGSGVGITDADGDGLDDQYDSNTSDISTGASVGLVAVNTDNITENNTDANPDYLDTDSDGDGTLDINENGNANTLTGTDTDGDGYDDAFEGVITDADVNDDVNDPATDLPDIDTDVNIADSAQPDAAGYNDVDYRDIDDDRAPPSVVGNILWLRADIGASGGGTVTNWADQSGSGFNATNTGTAPTYLNDSDNLTTADGLNFNPTLQFTGTQDLEITGGGILGNGVINNDIWVYGVSASTSATNASFIFSNAVTGGAVEFQAPTAGSLLSLNNATGTTLTTAWGGTINEFNLWNGGSSSGTSTPSGTNKAIYRDGLELATNNTGGSTTFTSNNSSSFIGSDNTGANFFSGQIAEVMVFNTVPTSAEQQKIHSYLAIKYGITLDISDNDAAIVEGDYVIEGSPDFIVWDESENSAYHNDVAGIGRDDGKFLDQKQSRSINTSSIVSIGLGSVAANNASNSNTFANGSFLMWGHNGVTVNNTNTSSVTLLCENELELDREWKIVETGSVGTVEIAAVQATIDAALTTQSTEIIVLKIADDENFTTNVKHIPVTTRTINGVAHYVAEYDFDGTKYFTYSEVLGIFWNGDTTTTGSLNWTGGAGTNAAPAIDAIGSGIDGGKVLVIDAETSLNNATMTASANVGCLWVKANSKLVVSNDLFIEFDGEFILDGEIRLIGDAQLVQSHTGLSNVTGNGVIYRDQASVTPSTYRYNYWSSPVVTTLGNSTYTVETVMYDGTVPTSENSTTTSINWRDRDLADVSTLNSLPTDPITIATWWIYSYFNGVTRDDWVQKLNTGTINIGEGYIMKSTGRNPQNFTFMGSPNDGSYTKTLTPGTSSLLGNPYPSVIDTQQFITDNDAAIDGTLYFWEHQGESSTTTQVEGHAENGYIGGYSQRNQAMGVAASSVVDGTAGLGDGTYTAPPQFIAVGQGFFVSAPANKGGTVTFQNSQRTASTNNIFFQTVPEELPNFKIGMDYINDTEAEIHRQLGINFKEGNDFAYNSGFDSEVFDLQETDMFWDFDQIDSNLIIAGVGALSAELQVPLGFEIDTDHPVFVTLDEVDNMDGYTIYLGDLLTGRIYNLENPVELDLPRGTYSNRFVILFGGTALSTEDNPLFQGFNVFRNNTTDEIIIRNNNGSAIKKVEVFNLLGQQVKTWKSFTNTNEERFYFNPPAALYIVKVTTEKGETSKKIVID
ncbi:MAG: T9SS type A sorting domain-containing protein [Flavobacteriaceae bacterium]